MGFVVKAINKVGLEIWISPQRAGHRVCGPRENAEVFSTQAAAYGAIGNMPRTFGDAGFTFQIEPVECEDDR